MHVLKIYAYMCDHKRNITFQDIHCSCRAEVAVVLDSLMIFEKRTKRRLKTIFYPSCHGFCKTAYTVIDLPVTANTDSLPADIG